MIRWVLGGLALFLAIVWGWEYLDHRCRNKEREQV